MLVGYQYVVLQAAGVALPQMDDVLSCPAAALCLPMSCAPLLIKVSPQERAKQLILKVKVARHAPSKARPECSVDSSARYLSKPAALQEVMRAT